MPGAIGSRCPHCQSKLVRIGLDELMNDHPFDLACFDDDCPYYARGWAWMEQQYGVRASYRYRVDGKSGHESPLPVRSPEALRDSILPDDATAAPASEEQP